VKTVPEHFSPPTFGNQKKFPFSSPISGKRRVMNLPLKREIRDKKKKKRHERTHEWMERLTNKRKNARKKERERMTDRQQREG
jgi:hypothetical protein